MKRFFIFTGFLLLKFISVGQFNTEMIALQLKDSAQLQFKAEQYETAYEINNRAIFYASQTANYSLTGNCYRFAGDILFRSGKNSDAFQSYLKAATFYKKGRQFYDLSDVYYKVALICFSSEVYEKAVRYFELSDSIYPQNYNEFDSNYRITEYLGDAYYGYDKFRKAEVYYNRNYDSAKNKQDTLRCIASISKLIKLYKKEKNYPEVLKLNNELFSIYKKTGDANGKYRVCNNSGYIFVLMSDHENALKLFKEAESYFNPNSVDKTPYAKTLINIGICLQNKDEFEESLPYFMKAKNIFTSISDQKELADINNILAVVYLRKYDIYNASEYSLESIGNAKKSGDGKILENCYKTYSSVLQAADDYQSAMDYFKNHLALRDSLLVEKRISEQNILQTTAEFEKIEKETTLQLADEELKNMLLKQLKLEAEKAEKDLELLNKEKELAKSEKEMAIQTLLLERQKRNALLKEQQIKSLEHDKEVQSLILKQKESEQKEKQKEIELLQIQNEKSKITIEKQQEIRKRFLWTFGSVLIILALIVISLVSARRKNIRLKSQKKQIEQINDELNQQNEEIKSQKDFLEIANIQINEQKLEIEKKNEEITDSIKYAQRIQTAVLPPIDLITAGLSDFFIFYKPKDIVSGDFYWMKEIGENIIIAVADCTGHGVPGAFMSMLGIASLNELVTKVGFDDASIILDRLRKKVKKSLGQTGKLSEQKDGMDMVLMIIDKENMKLQYAGANNPMIVISEGKMNMVKPDRMPIGVYYNEKNFTNHILEIKKGDIVYAYSDGFQDQFGGEKGLKFYAKRFKNLLYEIHKEPQGKQQIILEETLAKWQSFTDKSGKTYEQVDDILVIGIKI
jgi:serine phosphatase RsbU (regulator of sigma subunit)/tetratricopeptide (TPR) repeat protein